MADKWCYADTLKVPEEKKTCSCTWIDEMQLGQYHIDAMLGAILRNGGYADFAGYLYCKELNTAIVIDTARGYKTNVLKNKTLDVYLNAVWDRFPKNAKLVLPADAQMFGIPPKLTHGINPFLYLDKEVVKSIFDEIEEDIKQAVEQEQAVSELEQNFHKLYAKNNKYTKKCRIIHNAITGFYESTLLKTQFDDMRSNELGLVIFGPPGVGKTFAVRWAQRELAHDCAWINLSGDSIDINALSDALYGYSILAADGSATKSDFVFGGFVQALGEAVKEGKNTMGIVVNEFNRSAAMGKLDQIIRDIGDNQSIIVETTGNLHELQSRLREQYGIHAQIERNGLRIDLNNIDGNGKRIGVFFLLIGNPPDAYISAAQYGVVPLTAALSRRLRSVTVDYINPYKEREDLINMFKSSASYKLLTKKYHSYVDDPTDEFDTKLLNTLETLYEAFYNMWTQHKIMIVPAPTEIGEQVENALMLYRDTLTNLQKCYREVFNAYFIKLGNAGLYRIGREDTVTDIADTFAASLVELGRLFSKAYMTHYIQNSRK